MQFLRKVLLLSLATLSITTATTATSDLTPFANIRCNGTKLPTPRYGTSGIVFTVCAEQEIHAPIQPVYDALLDFKSYPKWNTFVVDVKARGNYTIDQSPAPLGFEMTLITAGLIPGINTTSNEFVTITNIDVEGDGKKAISAWGTEAPGLKAEHPNILTDLGGGRTRYVSYESYYGAVANVVGLALKGTLQGQFERQGVDLRGYVEELM